MKGKGGNFERWSWEDLAGALWQCSECGKPVEQATHKGKGRRRVREPYNLHQKTCSPRCAEARKLRRQQERRDERREARKQWEEWARQQQQQQRAAPRGQTSTDDWSTLGLKPGASAQEVKSAYRRLARELHPDMHPGASEAELRALAAQFAAVRAAYGRLAHR